MPQIFRNCNICYFVFSFQNQKSFDNLGFYHRIIDNQAKNALRKTIGVDFGGERIVKEKCDYEVHIEKVDVEQMLFECV